MSAVYSKKNQYHGVNPHMHSLWQSIGKWNRFHNVHIGQLLIALKTQLIPLGYTAETEESLQIRRVADFPSMPRADILIGNQDPYQALQKPSKGFSATQTVPLVELIEDDEDMDYPYYSVAIYERLSDDDSTVPVAWLELLSPSNKGSKLDAQTYRAKRKKLLQSGLVFIEIDYLHETPSTFEHLPDYTKETTGSQPYRIVVIDPRPSFQEGRVALHQFGVDNPIPTVEIPLHADDQLLFDFDKVYQKTFEEALYGFDMDYRQWPRKIESYSIADRDRIGERMVAVLTAAVNNVDLEGGPFATESINLDVARVHIENLNRQLT